MISSPWAVLLCKFSDDNSEPQTRTFYEDLFTRSGAGTQNMVDFFYDASHGTLDLGSSKVFGWYTLDQKRSDYVGSGANQAGRDALVDWARAKASAAEVKLGEFVGVVVCMNVQTELFGGSGRVVCDNLSLQPSLLGQEMGHAYGLDHSRVDGSTADYKDPWDVMSTASPYEAAHAKYTRIGPFLNAANADSQGWLEPSRVWMPSTGFDQTVQLRPLSRRDLPGFLVARLSGYYVEFRVKEGWDAGICEPCVLIHYFLGGHSYLVPANNGSRALVKGSYFEQGSNSSIYTPWRRIEVVDLDPAGHVATLRLVDRPTQRPPVEGPVIPIGGVTVGGGGWVWYDGRLHPVPPDSPLIGLLAQIAAIQGAHYISNSDMRGGVLRHAYGEVARIATREQAQIKVYRSPAPRTDVT